MICPWLIWSNQHNAYWGPGSCGYTRDVDKAGRYSTANAARICESANAYRGNKLPHEIMVPSPELTATVCKMEELACQ